MNVLPELELNILDDDVLFELNKINHISIKRRIIRELIELKKSNAYIHLEYTERENIYRSSCSNINKTGFNFIVNITIMLKDESNIYKFEIASDYPFRAPTKFTINYKPYINYLKINSSKTMAELQTYTGLGCLCCNSINCASRWCPSTNIIVCIDEFKKFMQYRRNIINRIIVEKIINKYLISDINLLEWLF